MTTIPINVEDDFAALLRSGEQPLSSAARELMALELYRRGTISSGKAAEWLGSSRAEFINHASRLGIPAIQMTSEEWEAEAELASKSVSGGASAPLGRSLWNGWHTNGPF